MKRLFIILGLAYVAGRVIGAWSERRCLERDAREREPRQSYRIIYDDGTVGDWIPSSSNSQEVPHV